MNKDYTHVYNFDWYDLAVQISFNDAPSDSPRSLTSRTKLFYFIFQADAAFDSSYILRPNLFLQGYDS